jgi:hypothetical protein
MNTRLMGWVLSLAFLCSFSGRGFAGADPKASWSILARNEAVSFFLKAPKVDAEIQKLETAGFRQISVDAAPYASEQTEEGFSTSFLVTAWLAKSDDTRLVSAKVTDSRLGLGSVVIDLLDSAKLRKAVDDTGNVLGTDYLK